MEPELLEFYNLASSVTNSAQYVLNLPDQDSNLTSEKQKYSNLNKQTQLEYDSWRKWYTSENDSSIAWME